MSFEPWCSISFCSPPRTLCTLIHQASDESLLNQMCHLQNTNMCGARSNFIVLPLTSSSHHYSPLVLQNHFKQKQTLGQCRPCFHHHKSPSVLDILSTLCCTCTRMLQKPSMSFQQHRSLIIPEPNRNRVKALIRERKSADIQCINPESVFVSLVWSVKYFFCPFFLLGNFFSTVEYALGKKKPSFSSPPEVPR